MTSIAQLKLVSRTYPEGQETVAEVDDDEDVKPFVDVLNEVIDVPNVLVCDSYSFTDVEDDTRIEDMVFVVNTELLVLD